MSEPLRNDRLDMRLSAEHKTLIVKAAAISGQPLSTFAVATIVRRARQILADHETTVLSSRDRDEFLRILDEEHPSEKLHTAARKYIKRRG